MCTNKVSLCTSFLPYRVLSLYFQFIQLFHFYIVSENMGEQPRSGAPHLRRILVRTGFHFSSSRRIRVVLGAEAYFCFVRTMRFKIEAVHMYYTSTQSNQMSSCTTYYFFGLDRDHIRLWFDVIAHLSARYYGWMIKLLFMDRWICF